MPTVHDAKSINQRLGAVIKNVEKLKNQIGIFDNLDSHIRKLEQAVSHKIDTMDTKKQQAKNKAEAKKRQAAQEKAEREEQDRLANAVAAREAELEAEKEGDAKMEAEAAAQADAVEEADEGK